MPPNLTRKNLILLLLLLVALSQSYAQTLTGTVVDKNTKLPLSGAMITWGAAKTYTGSSGNFEIPVPKIRDSLRVFCFSYKNFSLKPGSNSTSLFVEMLPALISLKEVVI